MSIKTFMNQLIQTPIKGSISHIVNPVTLSVQIDPNSVSTLQAGDAVRLTQTTGQTILVDVCAATQDPYGYLIYAVKKNIFTAGDPVEIALTNSVIYLESAGLIRRGDLLEWSPAGHQVAVWGKSNPTSGLALDKVSSAGQLLRVKVIEATDTEISSSSSSSCRSSSSSSRSSSSSSSSSSSKSSSSSSSSSKSSSSSSSASSSSSSSKSSSSSSSQSSSSSSSSHSSSSSSSGA